jgi:DNA-nicking Smr family endonuclease
MASHDRKGKGQKKVHAKGTDDSPEPVTMPITGTLDLHTFSPAEIVPLMEDYLEACLEKGIHEVRIIHGKGTGVQRRRVHSFLSKSPWVQSFHDADPGGGGWGATLVSLKPKGGRD